MLLQVRLSDTSQPDATPHVDQWATRFELGRVGSLHAHLEVARPSVRFKGPVPVKCTLDRLEGERRDLLAEPYVQGAWSDEALTASWVVPLSVPLSGTRSWRPGAYQLWCHTSHETVATSFEVVDALVRATPLSGDRTSPPSGRVGPTEVSAPDQAISLPPAGGRTLVDSALSDVPVQSPRQAAPGLAAPVSDVGALDTPASAIRAESDAKSRSRESSVSLVVPRVFAASTADAATGREGSEFDTSQLTYVGYVAQPPYGRDGIVRMPRCEFERVATRVRWGGRRWLSIASEAIQGTSGSDHTGRWLPGDYRIVCDSIAGVGAAAFRVTGAATADPAVETLSTSLPEPDAVTTGIRFFAFGDALPALPARRYQSRFASPPDRVATEVVVTRARAEQPWTFDWTCHYFTANGRLLGHGSFRPTIPAGQRQAAIVTSLEPASQALWPDFWRPGGYFVECDVQGVFAASRYFEVGGR